MTLRSFADVVRAMIQETRLHKMELEGCASAVDPKQRHAVNDVLHAEMLRLDMLQSALTEWESGKQE